MRSVLVHRELPGDAWPAHGVWLPFHDRGGDAASLLPICRAAAPAFAVRAPQAARSCNAVQGGGASLGGYRGFAWWREEDGGAPEPASFADSLRQAERFLDDTIARHRGGTPVVALGAGQGAQLALALVLRRGADLAGVVTLEADDGATRRDEADDAEVARALAPVPVLSLATTHTLGAASAVGAWLRRIGLAALVACAAPGVAGDARASSAGPQPGMTGAAPTGGVAAEATCASCHVGAAVNPDETGRVALEGLPSRYEPGRHYALVFRIAHADAALQRWGFQLTAVRAKDGQGAGELVVTDPATTQRVGGMAGRQYVEHTDPGTAIGESGGTSWRFDWVAPADAGDEVLFFGLAVAADASGSPNGDRVYGASPEPLARVRGPGPDDATP
jgi:hypothetical protein